MLLMSIAFILGNITGIYVRLNIDTLKNTGFYDLHSDMIQYTTDKPCNAPVIQINPYNVSGRLIQE